MNKVIKFFLKGTVIILIAVPFLFTSNADAQEQFKLSLKEDKIASRTHIGTGKNHWFQLNKIPAFAGMTTDYEIAALTPFARKEGRIYEISSLNEFTRKMEAGYTGIYGNVMDTLTADSIKVDSNMTVVKPKDPTIKKFKMKKSPTTAVLLSAVLPGAGQFYNESYWKIPIIGGLVGYFGYEYFRNNNLYKDYRDEYAASQTELSPNGDLNLKTLREFYRDQRDDFVWYFLIVYVVGMVDAYVDAHLFDFDVNEEKEE